MSEGSGSISESSVTEVKPLGEVAALAEGSTSVAELKTGDADSVGARSRRAAPGLDAPSPDFLRVIPYEYARRHLVLGLRAALCENGTCTSDAAPSEVGTRAAADAHLVLAVGSTTSPIAAVNVGVAMKRSVVCEGVDDVALAEAI